MKREIMMMAILVSLSSLGIGMVIGLRISAAHPMPPVTNAPVAITPPPAPAQQPPQQPTNPPANQEDFDCVDLPPDHPLRAKLNGKRLPLNYAGLERNRKKEMLKNAKLKPLSHGRWLVALDDTLYMLDAKWHVRWRYHSSPTIIDFVIADSAGLIYGIAGDEVHFILDVTSGKKLWSKGYMGKAEFSQIIPYGRNGCLMTLNMAGYRVDEWFDTKENLEKFGMVKYMRDGLIAYRGTKKLWAADWPPDAELMVNGKDFYAVTKTDKSIYLRKIRISRLKKH